MDILEVLDKFERMCKALGGSISSKKEPVRGDETGQIVCIFPKGLSVEEIEFNQKENTTCISVLPRKGRVSQFVCLDTERVALSVEGSLDGVIYNEIFHEIGGQQKSKLKLKRLYKHRDLTKLRSFEVTVTPYTTIVSLDVEK